MMLAHEIYDLVTGPRQENISFRAKRIDAGEERRGKERKNRKFLSNVTTWPINSVSLL